MIGALAPRCEPVYVPPAIAVTVGAEEQWAVGSRSADLLLIPPPVWEGFVDSQEVSVRGAIVALHTWLDIGDHAPGHNFFRRLPEEELVTIDHCSGLASFLAGGDTAVTLRDPAGLLHGVDVSKSGDIAAVAAAVADITQGDLEGLVSDFPEDSLHPWFDTSQREKLVAWIVGRQAEVASVLTK